MKRDNILTELRNFEDPRSYVRRDESEVLYGKDWKKRVAELRERCQGRCEFIRPAVIDSREAELIPAQRCFNEAADPDHVTKRSQRRDDRLSNLQGLCRFHHNLKHPEKHPQWAKRELRP